MKTCPHCGKTIAPEKVSVYDPTVQAMREVPIELAREMIKQAKAPGPM